MIKVTIVNCFDTYENRIDLVHEFFKSKGYDVTVIQSDFRHFDKTHRHESKQDFIFVESKPYYKNMSLTRLSSHYAYAKDAFEIAEKINPDLLYVTIPPNSLAKFAAQYKKKHKNVKLIFDLIDLWPETMPIGRVKRFPPFTFWRRMRDNSLKFADFVITECDLYQSVLGDVLKGIKKDTVYLAKRNINVVRTPILSEGEMHLCYLGSINNIIDIPKIKAIIKAINEIKPTTLHIIGDGESKESLINEVKSTGSRVEYHGKIYDPQKKQDIFDKCHFGLNIMKESVCVGLTMKSVDYFQHCLPILNNIQADTSRLVEKYGVGYNVSDENIKDITLKITSFNEEEMLKLKKNARLVFDLLFSTKAFKSKLNSIFENPTVL